MGYFFDLEDYTNCGTKSSTYLKLMHVDASKFREDYYIENGTYEGYLPKQRVIALAPNGEIKVFSTVNGKISKSENEGFGSFCCENNVPLLMNSNYSVNGLPYFPNLNTSNIYWDNDTQACRWRTPSTENGNFDPFKIVVNPSGNDGTVFNVGKDDDCTLNVEFDFLFKYDCKDLTDTLETTNVITTTNINVKLINEFKDKIKQYKVRCESISNTIESITKEYDNTLHSINCEKFPTSRKFNFFDGPWYERNPNQPLPDNRTWGNTAFGDLTSFNGTAPFSYSFEQSPFYEQVNPTKSVNFCINEPEGLNQWKIILGDDKFNKFVDGDASSYTCNDVIALSNLNDIRLRNGQSALIYECKTPFGFKSSLSDNIAELTKSQENCVLRLKKLQAELESIETTETTETESTSTCGSPAQVLETLDVSFTIDIIENNGTHTTVLEQSLHEAIGLGNLYTYLTQHPTDSGFYIGGIPNSKEVIEYSLINSDIPLTYDNDTFNTSSCNYAKKVFTKILFTESNFDNSQSDLFNNSLSNTIFSSNWLNKSVEITDPLILDRIKNKKLTITLKVNDSCGNVCILMDNIKMDSNCINTKENITTLNSSPGFVLEKYVDNKKSWVNNISNVNRDFDVSDNKGNNSIRQTNYNVNDERLVINTKEIDLDVDISNAIEYDVWKYTLDNPCLLDCDGGCEDYTFDINTDVDFEAIFNTNLPSSYTPISGFTFITTWTVDVYSNCNNVYSSSLFSGQSSSISGLTPTSSNYQTELSDMAIDLGLNYSLSGDTVTLTDCQNLLKGSFKIDINLNISVTRNKLVECTDISASANTYNI